MKTIQEYEIVDHGIENEQYFQGCGVSFTKFETVATGIGNSFHEALNDAAEGIAQQGYELSDELNTEIDNARGYDDVADQLAANCEHFKGTDDEGSKFCDECIEGIFYYASIRVK